MEKTRILVVEDEKEIREMVVTVLSGLGYTVLEAKDGLNALDIYKKYNKKIHLLLTDEVMPRMSGSELSKQIKEL